MAIVSSRIKEFNPYSGRFRVRFEYTFTNGDTLVMGPGLVQNQAAADQKLIDLEPRALTKKQRIDAIAAVDLRIKVAHGEATTNQVIRAWQREGVEERDTLKAYRLLKGNVDQSSPQRAKDRWQYLNTHSVAIEAYLTVKQGDN